MDTDSTPTDPTGTSPATVRSAKVSAEAAEREYLERLASEVGHPGEDGRTAEPEEESFPAPEEELSTDDEDEEVLEGSYFPPEAPRLNHFGETSYEQEVGESHGLRLSEEEPEVWQTGRHFAPGKEPDRAGRLELDHDAGTGGWDQDLMVTDVGTAGGLPTAEEAAVHVLPEDGLDPADDANGDGVPDAADEQWEL